MKRMLFIPGCEEATDLQWERLDRRLPVTKRAALRAHLLVCQKCRAYQSQLGNVRQQLLDAGAPDLSLNYKVSEEFRKRLKEMIDEG